VAEGDRTSEQSVEPSVPDDNGSLPGSATTVGSCNLTLQLFYNHGRSHDHFVGA
jgi:hypothetical protein